MNDKENMDRLLVLLEKQAAERPISRIINNPMTYVGGLAVLFSVIMAMAIFIYSSNQDSLLKRIGTTEENMKTTLDIVKEIQTSQLVINATVKQTYDASLKNSEKLQNLEVNSVKETEIEKLWRELEKIKDYRR